MRIKLLLLLVIAGFVLKPFKSSAQVNVQDSLALVDLYDSTGGTNWNHSTNWLTSAPLGTWQGVTVVGGRVTQLSFLFNNMIGTIPYSLGNLSNLIYFEMSDNQLSGSIPSSLGNLSNLLLFDLANNQLTDSIPGNFT